MNKKYLVINSYPRSGNIYLSTALGIGGVEEDITPVHLPYIFDNPNLCQLSIIRNPDDCISSLLYRFSERNQMEKSISDKQIIDLSEEYILYIENALKSQPITMLVDFNDLVLDTLGVVEKIVSRYDLRYVKRFENNQSLVEQVKNSITTHEKSPYNGHIPRQMDSYRSEIEIRVKNSLHMDKARSAYQKFLDIK